MKFSLPGTGSHENTITIWHSSASKRFSSSEPTTVHSLTKSQKHSQSWTYKQASAHPWVFVINSFNTTKSLTLSWSQQTTLQTKITCSNRTSQKLYGTVCFYWTRRTMSKVMKTWLELRWRSSRTAQMKIESGLFPSNPKDSSRGLSPLDRSMILRALESGVLGDLYDFHSRFI